MNKVISEYRIGNFFRMDDLPIERITLETFKTISEHPHHEGLMRGVRLTDSFLETTKLKETGGTWYHRENDRFFILTDDPESDGYFINGIANHRIEIKYIHELQNAYFMFMNKSELL